MPDIMVWPEIILVIALVSKIQDGLHFWQVKLLDPGPSPLSTFVDHI